MLKGSVALIFATLLIVSPANSAIAQPNNAAGAIGGILGIIGSIAQGAARDKAQKEWASLSQPMQYCMVAALQQRRMDITRIINDGILPTDARLIQLSQQCTTLTNRTLRENIPCVVNDNRGKRLETMCDESYIIKQGGRAAVISYADYISNALQGYSVEVIGQERDDARIVREKREADQAQAEKLAAEEEKRRVAAAEEAKRAQAEEERKKFLASPAGKKWLAAEEAKRKRDEAEDARRVAAEQKAAAERQAKLQKEFPYYAVFTCGVGYGHIAITACISGDIQGSIELRNGETYGNYNLVRIVNRGVPNARDTSGGYLVDLRKSFEIRAQAGSISENLSLSLKIIQRASKRVVFQKEVRALGTIAVSN